MTISFRLRMLAIVVVVAVLPLAVLGLWLTQATMRSGEELLRTRLDQALTETVSRTAASWTMRTSELVDLAEAEPVRATLRDAELTRLVTERSDGAQSHHPRLEALFEGRQQAFRDAELLGTGGVVLWRWTNGAPAGPAEPAGIPMEVSVHDGPLGVHLGSLRASLSAAAVLGAAGTRSAGVMIGAFDPATGAALIPLTVDPELLAQPRFSLAGEEWLVSRRTLTYPAVQFVAAAPLTPFTLPLERVARRGTLLLFAISSAGIIMALLLTGYLTRSLGDLARAAESVAAGDLEQRIPVTGHDEVSRVATAFNSMTESLRRSLDELADKRALAAVGEFAASLAHEIRNPLTSLQLDMQMVEERLPPEDSVARATQARALAEIRRLDRTVSGALRATRAGRVTVETVDIPGIIMAAANAAAPAMREAGAALSLPGPETGAVQVRGDAGALEQIVLNLLLNAAQATPGGHVKVEARTEHDGVVITVTDDGAGMDDDTLARVFDPLFTTRREGAGLGLAIARRLVEAHGGSIMLESTPGRGTTARVTIPT